MLVSSRLDNSPFLILLLSSFFLTSTRLTTLGSAWRVHFHFVLASPTTSAVSSSVVRVVRLSQSFPIPHDHAASLSYFIVLSSPIVSPLSSHHSHSPSSHRRYLSLASSHHASLISTSNVHSFRHHRSRHPLPRVVWSLHVSPTLVLHCSRQSLANEEPRPITTTTTSHRKHKCSTTTRTTHKHPTMSTVNGVCLSLRFLVDVSTRWCQRARVHRRVISLLFVFVPSSPSHHRLIPSQRRLPNRQSLL